MRESSKSNHHKDKAILDSIYTEDRSTKLAKLFHLHFIGYPTVQQELFQYTGLDGNHDYYCIHTGHKRSLWHDRFGIDAIYYGDVYYSQIDYPITKLLDKHNYLGTPYLFCDDEKEIGVLFQETEKSTISPIELAREINNIIQKCYDNHLNPEMKKYRNVTVLSEPMNGYDGVHIGQLKNKQLKDLSFFLQGQQLLTIKIAQDLRNNTDYQTVMELCRGIGYNLSVGEKSRCVHLAHKLFSSVLKYSLDLSLTKDALSYLKHILRIRLGVYDPEHEMDIENSCNINQYVLIEECEEKICSILSHLCDMIQENGVYSDPVACSVCYIRQHLSKDISLVDISEYAGVASGHLSNIFHQQVGVTIKQFQMNLRIEQAKKLLISSDEQITNIARLCGFQDRTYFTTVFKGATGMTPIQYRKQHNNDCSASN